MYELKVKLFPPPPLFHFKYFVNLNGHVQLKNNCTFANIFNNCTQPRTLKSYSFKQKKLHCICVQHYISSLFIK